MEKLLVLRIGVVDLDGDRVRGDRGFDEVLWIRHGIQRLASPSTGVKNIEEYEFPLVLGAFEHRCVIVLPER